MPFLTTPLIEPASASRPIVWRTFFTGINPDTVKIAEAEVFFRGVSLGKIRSTPYATQETISPGVATEFLFRFNVSDLVRQNVGAVAGNLPSVIANTGSSGLANNQDFYGDLFIVVEYYTLINATGKLTNPVGTETSNTVLVYATARQHEDSMDLQEFITILPTQEGRPLTDMPLQQSICEQDNAAISFISNWDYMRVQVFDLSGGNLGVFFASQLGVFNQQATAGVGPQNLAQYVYFGGFPFPPLNTIGSYRIDFGYGIPVGPLLNYTQVSDTYTYTINRSCCEKQLVRLHWVNTLGGSDSYNFTGSKEEQVEVKGEFGQKSLNWAASLPAHSKVDVGAYKFGSDAETVIRVETGVVPPNTAKWLEGVLYSPYVLIEKEINGSKQYVSCVVEDARQVVKRSRGGVPFALTVRLANNIITSTL